MIPLKRLFILNIQIHQRITKPATSVTCNPLASISVIRIGLSLCLCAFALCTRHRTQDTGHRPSLRPIMPIDSGKVVRSVVVCKCRKLFLSGEGVDVDCLKHFFLNYRPFGASLKDRHEEIKAQQRIKGGRLMLVLE
jgi:hypothetical protein